MSRKDNNCQASNSALGAMPASLHGGVKYIGLVELSIRNPLLVILWNMSQTI